MIDTTEPKCLRGVPGQAHERQLENISPPQPHADVWEEEIYSRTALKVAEKMWRGDQVAIEQSIGRELPIRRGDRVQDRQPVCRV